MTFLPTFLETPIAQALGWTLLHSLWQGSLIAVLMTICWRLLGERAAKQRYLLSLMGLASLLIWSGLTFFQTLETEQLAAVPTLEFAAPAVEIGMLTPGQLAADGSSLSTWAYIQTQLNTYTPWVALAWAIGCMLFLLRWIGAYAFTQGLRHKDATIMEGTWQNQLNELASRMGIRQTLLLIESGRISSPMTIGFFKPVVLVPIGLLTGMPAGQVEAILTHELAHIRRHDYLINLLVSLVETLFFFHPAVWWMGNRIREAREHCCDDLAIATSGDPMAYARALTELASAQSPALAPGLIGPRKHLLHRIKRLFVAPQQPESHSRAIAAALTLAVLFLAGWMTPSSAGAAEPDQTDLQLLGGTGTEIPWFYESGGDIPAVAEAPVILAAVDGLPYPIVPIDSPPPAITPPAPPTPPVMPAPAPPTPPSISEDLSQEEMKEVWKAYADEMKKWEKTWSQAQKEGWKEYAEAWEEWGESFAESMEQQDWYQWRDSATFRYRTDVDWDDTQRERLEQEMEVLQEELQRRAEVMSESRELRQEEMMELRESMQEQKEELRRMAMELRESAQEENTAEVERQAREIEREAAKLAQEVIRVEREARQVEAQIAREQAELVREKAMQLRELAMQEAEIAREAEIMALQAFQMNSEENLEILREALLADGLLKNKDGKITIKSKDGKLKINGTNLSGSKLKKYQDLLNELGFEVGTGSTTHIRVE